MKRQKAAVVILLALLVACNRPVTGSLNSFDSNTYIALATTDGVIEGTKADLNNQAFSATVAPKVAAALNGLISAYDAARAAWLIYHGGNTTAAQQTVVANAMANVNIATTNLTNVKGGK
jgi:hypothetical protein